MAAQHGGEDPDRDAQDFLDDVCFQIISQSTAGTTDWPFECTLLADPQTINAFALPGGQTFINGSLV